MLDDPYIDCGPSTPTWHPLVPPISADTTGEFQELIHQGNYVGCSEHGVDEYRLSRPRGTRRD